MLLTRSVAMLLLCAALLSPTVSAPTPAAAESSKGVAGLPQFVDLVKGLQGSVVNISVDEALVDEEEVDDTEEGTTPPGDGGKESAPKGSPDQNSESPFRSAGSGFVLTADGIIVTNNHVVGKADKVVVRFLNDKEEYDAKVIGRDKKTDLALVKMQDPRRLVPVILGDSDQLEVGEWVVAIGNQFQLGQTVTAGIVSAKGRKVPSQAGPYDSFIQTDASINPGSSGGPLLNTKGEVVGINSAIFSPVRSFPGQPGFNIGIGFSIPINMAKRIFEQLREKGKVTRGMLGVMIQTVDRDVADALGLKGLDGAIVADVLPDSPAARAGFKRRDVVLSFNGEKIVDYDDLPMRVASTPVGSTVPVVVLRSGKEITLTVTVSEMKDSGSSLATPSKPAVNRYGFAAQTLTPELGQSFGIPTGTSGAFIELVERNSRASRAGLFRGDVIVEVNGVAVADRETLERALNAVSPGKAVLLGVRKREGIRLVALK